MAYRVVEEITKKTLEGEQIQYLVQAAMPKTKTVRLETIKGNIYEDADEAKMKLIENATRAIDGMAVKIQNAIDKYFTKAETVIETKTKASKKPKSNGKLKEGYQWMDLEDGTRAQVKIPEIMK